MTVRTRLLIGLCGIAIAGVLVAILTALLGRLSLTLGPARIRSTDPLRAAEVSLLATAFIAAVGWRSRAWRSLGILLLLLAGALSLALFCRDATPRFPIADMAFIELYTRHALKGYQLLGPYSQYGWFHPGPFLFYWLAIFYSLGGQTFAAVVAGTYVANALSLLIVALTFWRRRQEAPGLSVVLWAVLGLLLLRVPDLITSPWNPHVAILPLLASLVLGSAAAAGDVVLLPLAAIFFSFVAQTHVGFAPVAAVSVVVPVIWLMARTASRVDSGTRSAVAVLGTVVLLQLIWMLPLAEELVTPEGNMTRLFRFFFRDMAHGQTMATAWHVWSGALTAFIFPGFTLPIGAALTQSRDVYRDIAGLVLFASLVGTSLPHLRPHRGPLDTLAIICIAANMVSFWSVIRIRGPIGDYHVFWICIVGALTLVVVVHNLWMHWLAQFYSASQRSAVAAPAVALGIICSLGALRLSAMIREADAGLEPLAVRQMTEAVVDWLGQRSGRPVVRLDSSQWGIGAGVVLQLDKSGVDFGGDELAELFGARLAASGKEDAVLLFNSNVKHQQWARDQRLHTIIEIPSVHMFVDAMSLSDAPEYRDWRIEPH